MVEHLERGHRPTLVQFGDLRLPDYPKTYSPQKHTEGIFGIIDGPETRVELLLRNADTVAYLSSRRLHPTQQFTPRRDGTTLLTMTVRGTTELLHWILSFGPYVEVLKPRALREKVQESLAEAMSVYMAPVAPTRHAPLPAATRPRAGAGVPLRDNR